MDVFEQLLTSSSGHRSVNPETLELLGTKASNMFLEKRASLNEAIVKLASEYGELNNEHVHRIAEFANNVTFQKLFERDHNKNIHFPVADPGVIIRDLRDGGSPAHDGKVLHNKGDYTRPPIPGEQKTSFADPQSGMEDLFRREDSSGQFGQGEPVEKTASAAGLDPSWEGSANPINDVYAEHTKLQRARQDLVAEHESADLLVKQARADFYRAVKTEVLSPSGAGLGGVVAAFDKVASDYGFELQNVVDGLMLDGVKPEVLERSMRKTAGRVLNPAHPLVTSLEGLVKCAQAKKVAALALKEVDAGLEKTAAFLKSQVRR